MKDTKNSVRQTLELWEKYKINRRSKSDSNYEPTDSQCLKTKELKPKKEAVSQSFKDLIQKSHVQSSKFISKNEGAVSARSLFHVPKGNENRSRNESPVLGMHFAK